MGNKSSHFWCGILRKDSEGRSLPCSDADRNREHWRDLSLFPRGCCCCWNILLHQIFTEIQPSCDSPRSGALAGTPSNQVMEKEGPLTLYPWSATVVPTQRVSASTRGFCPEVKSGDDSARGSGYVLTSQAKWSMTTPNLLRVACGNVDHLLTLLSLSFLIYNVEVVVPRHTAVWIQRVNSLKAFQTVLSI